MCTRLRAVSILLLNPKKASRSTRAVSSEALSITPLFSDLTAKIETACSLCVYVYMPLAKECHLKRINKTGTFFKFCDNYFILLKRHAILFAALYLEFVISKIASDVMTQDKQTHKTKHTGMAQDLKLSLSA